MKRIGTKLHAPAPSGDAPARAPVRPGGRPVAGLRPLLGATMIRIGCSGWQYKHWKGDFYPADAARPASGSSTTPHVRHGRDQQQLLPAAGGADVPALARARACRVPLRGQGEPLSDAHEEAEGSGGTAAAVLRACRAARRDAWARALPAAAALAARSRSVAPFPRRAAPARPARRSSSGSRAGTRRRCSTLLAAHGVALCLHDMMGSASGLPDASARSSTSASTA